MNRWRERQSTSTQSTRLPSISNNIRSHKAIEKDQLKEVSANLAALKTGIDQWDHSGVLLHFCTGIRRVWHWKTWLGGKGCLTHEEPEQEFNVRDATRRWRCVANAFLWLRAKSNGQEVRPSKVHHKLMIVIQHVWPALTCYKGNCNPAQFHCY